MPFWLKMESFHFSTLAKDALKFPKLYQSSGNIKVSVPAPLTCPCGGLTQIPFALGS